MSEKLYRVHLCVTIYVLAVDEREAEREATYNVREEIDNALAHVVECTKSSHIERDWLGAIPYGARIGSDLQGMTCRQIVARTNANTPAAGDGDGREGDG